MRSVEEQLQAAIDLAGPLASLDLSLREARGCVISEDVTATYPIPSFDVALVDGIAVKAESISDASAANPTRLRVVDSVTPGYTSDFQVEAGQAVRVLAGTLLPKGADTVIALAETVSTSSGEAAANDPSDLPTDADIEVVADPADTADTDNESPDSADGEPESSAEVEVEVEAKLSRKERKLLKRKHAAESAEVARVEAAVAQHVAAGGEWVTVAAAQPVGTGVARAGSQRAEGAQLLAAGTRLGDRELATVAAGGHSRVAVHPEPRVVIITVGDELVDTTRALIPGLAYDVVSIMLVAAGEQAGATTFRGGPSRRDALVLARTVQDQLVRADLIVIAGEDESVTDPQEGLVASALRAAGCQDLEYCQLKPGPAIGVGTVGEDGIAVIAVGASALAAFVGFEVLVRPVIAALAGRKSLFRPVVRAKLTESLSSHAGIREFVPANVRFDDQGAHPLVGSIHESAEEAALWLGTANGLIILSEDQPAKQEGDEVAVIRLDRE